jgi:hypothetical protein
MHHDSGKKRHDPNPGKLPVPHDLNSEPYSEHSEPKQEDRFHHER